MIQAATPNLWEMRREIGEVKTRAVVMYSLVWLAELVNVERNLTEVQIGELANDIINDYGHFKVEEIKYIFKQAVKSEKIYGRLDYNVVMGWIGAYDSLRTATCMDMSDQEALERENKPNDSPTAISYDEYVASLRLLAAAGDESAELKVNEIDARTTSSTAPVLDRYGRAQKEIDFKRFYFNDYLRQIKS